MYLHSTLTRDLNYLHWPKNLFNNSECVSLESANETINDIKMDDI